MTAEIQRHWDRVADLGCIVTGNRLVTLHHAHGGSMKERGIHRSTGRKTSDWLVIPLTWNLHVGFQGIDVIGVLEWEAKYGKQADMLDAICQRLGVDVWARAAAELKPTPRKVA